MDLPLSPKIKPVPKPKKPSFVVELPLVICDQAQRQLDACFLASTRLVNVMIQEGRTIIAHLRSDPDWEKARKLPAKTKPQMQARSLAFAGMRKKHGISEYDFHKSIAQHKNAGGFRSRVGANVAQKLATRVFNAFNEHLFGKRGLPRFKSKKRPLRSLEEKNTATGIRWDSDASEVLFAGFRLKAILPDLKKDEWLAFALQSKTKYCRLVCKNVNGKKRHFVQLIQDGQAPIKDSVSRRLAKEGSVGGLDIGPSTLAWVTDVDAGLQKFCPQVVAPQKQIRVLQRRIDRQRRAANPGNFLASGVARKGARNWVTSRRQRSSEKSLERIQSTLARQRKCSHGVLSNELMSHALSWRDDGVSVKSLQKNFGKSVGARAPGAFLDALTRKAERAGGERTEQNARVLKTSQYDHSTQTCTRKKLSERWHSFGDGRGRVQRDIYSAFLARNARQVVDEEGVIEWAHDPEALEEAWGLLVPSLKANGWFVEKGLSIEPVRALQTSDKQQSAGFKPARGSNSSEAAGAKVFPKGRGLSQGASSTLKAPR